MAACENNPKNPNQSGTMTSYHFNVTFGIVSRHGRPAVTGGRGVDPSGIRLKQPTFQTIRTLKNVQCNENLRPCSQFNPLGIQQYIL